MLFTAINKVHLHVYELFNMKPLACFKPVSDITDLD